MWWRKRANEDREWRDEIETYVAIETDDNIARGMDPVAARRAAQRKFGNPTLVREEIYQMNTIAILDSLARGVRHSLRLLHRNPMFAAAALLTLALGIGANTAVFSVVNSIVLKPLPFPDADRLVSVRNLAPGAPGLATIQGELALSPSMYFTFAEQNRVFASFGVWRETRVTLSTDTEAEQVTAVSITDGVLQAYAIPTNIGRWLDASDQVRGTDPRVMLGYGYWQRRYGGDASVLGRTVRIDSRPARIVGVLSPSFRLGTGEPDLIVPAMFDRATATLAGFAMEGVGRLRTGATLETATADLQRLLPLWRQSWPGPSQTYEAWRIAPFLQPLKARVVGPAGRTLWLLMAAIGLVMIIACVNVANLLLVRTQSRQRELAIRAALGAGPGRIARELLFESVTLSLLGGILGVAAAWAALKVLVRFVPATLPRLDEIALDWQALVFAFALSLLSGALFGLAPVLQHIGARALVGLRQVGSTNKGIARIHTREVLVVAQVALALVVLVGAGLMIRTFLALNSVRPGFTDPETLQTLAISIPRGLVAEPLRMEQEIVRRMEAIPGVASAAFSSNLPLDGSRVFLQDVIAEGGSRPPNAPAPLRHSLYVSPGEFQTAGTRLAAGRDYTWTDLFDLHPVVVISENLAREEWGSSQKALGRRLRAANSDELWEVVGVVEDVRYNGLDQPAPAVVYWPASAIALRNPAFIVRTSRAGTEAFVNEIRRAIQQVNPNLAISLTQTMRQISDHSLARTSFTMGMLALAGLMALLLGAIGIYGVIAYTVLQRRKEMAIRLALGALPSAVRARFVRNALALAAVGLVLGSAVAATLSRWMSSLLFEVSALDPITYGAVAMVLTLAAAAASYFPARRASRVDPLITLRSE